jgi:hypothetical protein
MIDVVSARETLDGYSIRAWTGVATDEGVGLLSIVEVADGRGRTACRFEVFLPAGGEQVHARWGCSEHDSALGLQEEALRRAREAVAAGSLAQLHGHRFDA